MNRVIRFRGKRKDSKQWVCGDLHTICGHIHIHVTPFDKYNIDRATVGQSVALRDNDGVEIYEGDIMGHPDEPNRCVVFWNGQLAQFQANWQNMPTAADIYTIIKMGYKVIGNIHDNPELLKY